MTEPKPGLFEMMRAPFFSSILSPLLTGSFIASYISGQFSALGFLLVLLMGIALHAATNVYNDIYDTLQGTDRINRHRNEFSGGSGIILQYPHLQKRMFLIARYSLLIALMATIALTFFVRKELWILLWSLYVLSAFFSKYYTAAPFKLAYRGLGEISVWFAFGPMAILVASVSQNVGVHPDIIAAMPLTGISTLSILLIGQLIDLTADKDSGKLGVAARYGTKFTYRLYVLVQAILITNLIYLSFAIENGTIVLAVLTPYMVWFAKVVKLVSSSFDDPDKLKNAAAINIKIHLLFSVLLAVTFLLRLVYLRFFHFN